MLILQQELIPKKEQNRFSEIISRFEQKLGNENAGICYAMLWSITYFVSSLYLKENQASIGPFQIITWRGLITCICSYIYLAKNNISLEIPDNSQFWTQLVRNFLVSQCQFLFYFLVTKIPLSLIYLMQQITAVQLFILDYFNRRTQITIQIILGILFTFIGVGITFYDTEQQDITDDNNTQNNQVSSGITNLFWVLIYLASLTVEAFGIQLTGNLKQLNPVILVFYYNLFFLIGGGIAQMICPENHQLSLIQVIQIIVFVGLNLFIAQTAYIRAMQIGNQGKCQICAYFQVLFSFLIEIFMYDQQPSTDQYIGTLAICTGVLLTLYKKN